MSPDLELQVALAARVLGKTPEWIVEEATRLFCRSIAGQKDHAPWRRPAIVFDDAKRKAVVQAAAKRVTDSPGSIEGRIVAFVKKHGTATPSAIAAAMKVDIARNRRVLRLLEEAGVLRMTGATASRRVTLG